MTTTMKGQPLSSTNVFRSPKASSFTAPVGTTRSSSLSTPLGSTIVAERVSSAVDLQPRIVEKIVGPKIIDMPEAMAAPITLERAPPSPRPQSPHLNARFMSGTQRISVPAPTLERAASLNASPMGTGQFFGQYFTPTDTAFPIGTSQRMASMPQTMNPSPRSVGTYATTYQVPSRNTGSPMQVSPQMAQMQMVPTNSAQMVAMPASVLTHIDNVVTEMERELSEIRAYEQRQEACEIRQVHLNEIRRLVAERLLNNGDEEEELRQVRAEVSRLSILEADHEQVKKHVSELEHQRSTWEHERDELLHVRSAFEVECESRGASIRAAAQAVEQEKLRATRSEETANERVQEAANEARYLQEQLIEAESKAERGAEIQAAVEADLKTLEGSSRKVLNDCNALQSKIQTLQSERVEITVRVSTLETENDDLRALDDENKAMIADMRALDDENKARIADMENEIQEHCGGIKIHIKNIDVLETQNGEHQGAISMHITRIEELEMSIRDHANRNKQHGHKISDLENQLVEAQDRDGHHNQQHAAHRRKLIEMEEEFKLTQGHVDGHAKQNILHRQKITEMEQFIANSEMAEAGHHRQHATNRSRIQEFETALKLLGDEKDNHARTASGHKLRVKELEQHVDDHKAEIDKHTRKHGIFAMQIQERDQLVSELQAGDANHNRQHSANKARYGDHEKQLLELQSSHDKHAQQSGEHKRRIIILQEEIEAHKLELQSSHDKHAQQGGEHKRRIIIFQEESEADKARMEKQHRAMSVALEGRLADAEGARDKHMQQSTVHRQTLAELESHVDGLRSSNEGHGRTHGSQKIRIVELETQLEQQHAEHLGKHRDFGVRFQQLERDLADKHMSLEEVKASEAHHRGEHERHKMQVTVLERTKIAAGDFEQRIASLMQQLAEKCEELRITRAELERMRATFEQVQRDADEAFRVSESLEGQLRKAQAMIEELQGRLEVHEGKAQKRASKKSIKSSILMNTTSSNQSPRRSLWGQLKPRLDFSVGPFLPGSNDPFIKKIQGALVTVSEALMIANDAHVRCIDSQIMSAMEARNNGRDMKVGLNEFAERVEIDADRRAARDQVEAAVHELKALREELHVQHKLSEYEQKEVSSRIELELDKCNDESARLRADSALGDLPDSTLQMLLTIQETGPSVNWENGFSPMHWAAKNGRRDIIEYLLRLEGGRSLLEGRDEHGRAPLYYAQANKRAGCTQFLKDVVGTGIAPIQARDARPSTSFMPEPYQEVLDKIEHHGWESMNWKDGYTMLHWAANKGHVDVCKYLLQLHANVQTQDGSGRTSIDVARDQGNDSLAGILQSHAQRGSIYE